MKAVRQQKTSSRPISLKEYLEIKEDITFSLVEKIDALKNEMNIKFESIEKRLNLIIVLFSMFLSLITVLITVFKFIK